MKEEEIIKEAIEEYENKIMILKCCIATLNSNLFLEQLKKNNKQNGKENNKQKENKETY